MIVHRAYHYSTTLQRPILFLSFSCYDKEKAGEKRLKIRLERCFIYFYIICFSVAKKRIPLSNGILLRALQFWNTATDTRSVSFLYPPSLRYLPISTPFFPYISSYSPLPSLRTNEFRSGLQGRRILFLIPFLLLFFPRETRNRILTRRTTIRDFSHIETCSRSARILSKYRISFVFRLQFQRLFVWNNVSEVFEEKERVCYSFIGFILRFDEGVSKRMISYHGEDRDGRVSLIIGDAVVRMIGGSLDKIILIMKI